PDPPGRRPVARDARRAAASTGGGRLVRLSGARALRAPAHADARLRVPCRVPGRGAHGRRHGPDGVREPAVRALAHADRARRHRRARALRGDARRDRHRGGGRALADRRAPGREAPRRTGLARGALAAVLIAAHSKPRHSRGRSGDRLAHRRLGPRAPGARRERHDRERRGFPPRRALGVLSRLPQDGARLWRRHRQRAPPAADAEVAALLQGEQAGHGRHLHGGRRVRARSRQRRQGRAPARRVRRHRGDPAPGTRGRAHGGRAPVDGRDDRAPRPRSRGRGHADVRPSRERRLPSRRGGQAPRAVLLRDERGSARRRGSPVSDAGCRAEGAKGEWEPVVGRAVSHESADGHVTGRARYVDDLWPSLPRLAHAWPVTAPHARARVVSIDASAAQNAAGVSCVLTAADVTGENDTGPARHDEPLFPSEVSYHGQPVAWVIADSEDEARRASSLVRATFEPLPPVLSIEHAIREQSFLTDVERMRRGKPEEAMLAAPNRLEGELFIGGQEHFYLETQAALALVDESEALFVQSSTQHPTETQEIVARVLGVPKNEVVVQCLRMGGAFGGKETQANAWAAVAALAAKKLSRPVRVRLTRAQDMAMTGKRHPFLGRFRVGFSNEGVLSALKLELYCDGGWSLDLSAPILARAMFHADNCYL